MSFKVEMLMTMKEMVKPQDKIPAFLNLSRALL